MNRNNNNSQMPVNQPQQNVPDQRFDQMQERLRQLELQNTQLRTTVDYLQKAPATPGQPAREPLFKPEVEEAIMQTVQRMVQPIEQKYQHQIGYLADQLDEAKFQQNYNSDKFQPYLSKVEQVRQQAQAENRYLTREDALKLVYFEETGKKNVAPAPQQPQAPKAPVYDPFFNGMTDPDTGKPIQADNSGFAPQEQDGQNMQPQQNMQQNMQQGMQWQQPQQFQPQQQSQQTPPGAQQGQGHHPHGNAYGQHFQLPNQGMNPQSMPAHQQMNNGRQALGLESSDADLQAFENNFGDIPL